MTDADAWTCTCTCSDSLYHCHAGNVTTQHAAFGEALQIAVTLRMHDEMSYEGLDLIESQVRRRAFWLLFCGALAFL